VEQLLVVEITKFIHLQDQELLQFRSVGNPLGSTTVDYLVVAGGGGGGGGGGAPGGEVVVELVVIENQSGAASGCYSASPLGSGVSALPVSVQGYPITIGAGGGGTGGQGWF
jgi:hypothetical protein